MSIGIKSVTNVTQQKLSSSSSTLNLAISRNNERPLSSRGVIGAGIKFYGNGCEEIARRKI